ncbi:hypothetical protein [Aquiflexum lacus]|uniref:hypothetical protein n=1 Tax=Aquiflexum lacus TaxID=2483805 RepID=UPI0018930F85|nr:hypothetical protein [Aquiflexum lacus]
MLGSIYHTVIALSLFISFISVFVTKKEVRSIHILILVILAWVLAFESYGLITSRKGINNSLLYNVSWVNVESLLLISYFYILEKSQQFKKRIIQTSLIIIAWGVVNSIFLQPIALSLQYYSLLPFAAFIIFLAIRLLKNLLNLQLFPDQNLMAIPHFWISSTVLFFYLEALLLFGTYQFNPEFVVENVIVLFAFNKFMAGLMYIFFGISFIFPHLSKNSNILKIGLVFLLLISNISFIFLNT